jgi:hypothetical protein
VQQRIEEVGQDALATWRTHDLRTVQLEHVHVNSAPTLTLKKCRAKNTTSTKNLNEITQRTKQTEAQCVIVIVLRLRSPIFGASRGVIVTELVVKPNQPNMYGHAAVTKNEINKNICHNWKIWKNEFTFLGEP